MPYWKTVALIAALAVAGWVLTMYVLSAMGRRPSNLGVKEGRLAACPSSPNCVCSQDEDAGHAVEPIAFSTDADEAWAKFKKVLTEQPRTRIVSESENYLHAECTSLVFRFVDDLEFRLDREAKRIDVRSASRVGRSDFGVNRRRVEEIRKAFEGA
jgi:uncharacterized protein (DUF1499 family)